MIDVFTLDKDKRFEHRETRHTMSNTTFHFKRTKLITNHDRRRWGRDSWYFKGEAQNELCAWSDARIATVAMLYERAR
jgi:hypothetical protein